MPSFSKVQAFILLYQDVKTTIPEDVCLSLRTTLDSLHFPDLSALKIPLLTKKRTQKESLLGDLWNCCKPDEILPAHEDLIYRILLPQLEKSMENVYFEKVYWSTKCRKVAGIYIVYLWFSSFFIREYSWFFLQHYNDYKYILLLPIEILFLSNGIFYSPFCSLYMKFPIRPLFLPSEY